MNCLGRRGIYRVLITPDRSERRQNSSGDRVLEVVFTVSDLNSIGFQQDSYKRLVKTIFDVKVNKREFYI